MTQFARAHDDAGFDFALISDHFFLSLGGTAVTAQGICLPLLDVLPDGSRFYLVHTSWRPKGDDMLMHSVRSDFNKDDGRIIETFTPVAVAV